MYKAVCLDLDGTLLDDNKKISEENKEAIKYVQSKEGQIILCSGRQINLMKDYKDEINASEYVIGCNGAIIYDYKNNQSIFEANVAEDLVDNLYDYCIRNNYLARIDTKYARYISDMNYFISKEVKMEENINKFINENKVLQFTIGTKTENQIDEVIEYVNSLNRKDIKIENRYHIKTKQFEIWAINIINKNASKGNAINGLCKYLKINIDEVIAIGDDLNDISMIKTVGCGVAMGNAKEKVKEFAKEVTLSSNENGVSKILRNKF